MKAIKTIVLVMVFIFGISSGIHAAMLTPVSTTGSGSYSNSLSLLTDSIFPNEFSGWTNSTNVYWHGENVHFIFDFGNLYQIEDIIVSVDNNDGYKLDYSTDSSTWTNAFTIIGNGMGDVWYGMDTMSTRFGDSEYVSGIDFTAFNAQYLKFYGVTPSDRLYAVGEVQTYGSLVETPPSVPEPATLLLLGGGLMGLVFFRKKRT